MTFRALVFALLFSATLPAWADDWYAVEIIVFQHRDDASVASERFPADPGTPSQDSAVLLAPPTDPPTIREFERIPPGARQLGATWRTLERSSRYQPLLHAAWRQIGRTRGEALPVHIDLSVGDDLPPEPLSFEFPSPDGTDARPEDEPIETMVDLEVAKTSAAEATAAPDPVAALRLSYAKPPPVEPLVGTVRLGLQRFLHLEIDLLLRSETPLDPGNAPDWATARDAILYDLDDGLISVEEAVARLDELNAQPRFEAWRLQDSRRLRSGEIHYIDHPRFGVIVVVHPITEEGLATRAESWERAFQEALQRQQPPSPVDPSQ